MRFDSVLLFLAIATSSVSAMPAPTFDEIERRWNAGQSEVCLSTLPGCYVLAWFKSLSRRVSMPVSFHYHPPDPALPPYVAFILMSIMQAEIHAEHTHRDATPAWPVKRSTDQDAEYADNIIARFANPSLAEDRDFASALDERTMLARKPVVKYGKRSEATLLEQMKQFVSNFMARKAEGVIETRGEAEEEAPVLRPRKGTKYAFTA